MASENNLTTGAKRFAITRSKPRTRSFFGIASQMLYPSHMLSLIVNAMEVPFRVL
jgi:hypothetical protein